MRSGRETVAEHWETANGLRLGRLVLKNVPVLAPVYGRFSEGFATADLTAARRLLDELAHE